MHADAVGVVGTGAITAIGLNAPATAAAARAGIAGFAEHPFMIDTAGQPMIVARAPNVGVEVRGVDRLLGMALPAATEAVGAVRERVRDLPPLPAIVGLPPSRPGGDAEAPQALMERLPSALGRHCQVHWIQTIQSGHSAGLMALQWGRQILADGRAEFCLIGGVDSYLEPETLEWLEECEQLHAAGPQNNAWGFIPAEAAGFCVLASAEAMRRYGLASVCRVLSVATARERNLIKSETVCLGHGLTEAVHEALAALPPTGTRIDQTVCDANGEPYRADEFGFMLARTSERFIDGADYLAPADCWGDVGAASGPLFVTLAAAAGRRGYAKGPHWLLWTSSEGGERSAALLRIEAPPKERR